MHLLRQKRKSIAVLVILALSTFSIISAPVHAAMVNTAEILKQSKHNFDRDRINTFLGRSEVQKHLRNWGINPEEAKARTDSLTTDQEIEKIVASIDQLPAGGGALGTIVGAALIIFIVLLITDILGLTDIFYFVKKR